MNIHEPVVPALSWDAVDFGGAALVGTFHTYGTNAVTHGAARACSAPARRMHRLHRRIAVSEAAAWTAKRFFGGRYAIVPNGVDAARPAPPEPRSTAAGRLRIAFVGQAVERKGLPVLLGAFEGLREHIDVELVIVGAVAEEVEPLLLDARGVHVLGRVSDEEKTRVLREADVLCAPSLGGESFGMVLTEAFAQGTPVVASDIAGYRDVVRHGVDGLLVPRGDATALAETLRDLALEPAAPRRAGRAPPPSTRSATPGRASPRRSPASTRRPSPRTATCSRPGLPSAWPRALALRSADGRAARPGDAAAEPRARACRRVTGVPAPRRSRAAPAFGVVAAMGVVLTVLAMQRIGVDRVGASLIRSSPPWVIAALGVMCLSMVLRAISWHAILRAALPEARLSRFAALQGTSIGVLMSATLPARLGEPSRALVVARRAGRPRETLPTVIGTLVSQTLLNVLALVILGVDRVLDRPDLRRPSRRARRGDDRARRAAVPRARRCR